MIHVVAGSAPSLSSLGLKYCVASSFLSIIVTEQSTEALFAVSAVFLAVTLFDWWVMWGNSRVMGRTSERLLHALRVKVFAHLQRLGVNGVLHFLQMRRTSRCGIWYGHERRRRRINCGPGTG